MSDTSTTSTMTHHVGDSVKQMDHSALTDLIKNMNETHVAVNSGSWFDPNTWQGKRVPGDGAKVLIPQGVTVTYDQKGDARIDTVAIEGGLKFVDNQDTRLLVETILNAPNGTFDIGSGNRSVAADKTAEIIFTSDRAISDNKAWDPTQLSKGFVSHGRVGIYGADKAGAVALAGDAKAGDNVLTLSEVPSGWKVDDKIVLGGTRRDNNGSKAGDSYFQDEELTITAIDGNKVSFTNDGIKTGDRTRLKYDHLRPDIAERDSLNLYVANTTRNVSFKTEGGDSVPIYNRAHVMFMHNSNVTVENAGFYQLGRSDKSKLADDVDKNVDGSTGYGTNPRGRYSLHFHRNGADNLNSTPAVAKGNAVVGSPGWGIVHHDSHANVQDNVVFDTVGAGIAAESGNEIGVWENNTVIKTVGAQTKYGLQHPYRRRLFDFGVEGNAYWVQGAAQVQMRDNVAISSNATGLTLFGEALEGEFFKDVDTIAVKDLPLYLQKLFPADQTEVDVNDIPLREFKGFQSYNTDTGINFWGHMTNPDGLGEFLGGSGGDSKGAHEGKSLVEDFKLWGNSKGLHVIYSGNLNFDTGLIVSDKPDIQAGVGIKQNGAAVHTEYNNINVQGFFEGIDIDAPDAYAAIDRSVETIRNSKFSNNRYNLAKVGHDKTDFDAFARFENTFFEPKSGNKAPVARFTQESIGGTAIAFDGGDSYDSDPIEGGAVYPLESKGIAAYGWDFDNDGEIDDFGRYVNHYFDKAGSQKVGLTVWDNQGQISKLVQDVDVTSVPYKDAFVNGDFSDTSYSNNKGGINGWNTDGALSQGALKLSKRGKWNSFLKQQIDEGGMRRGVQTLSFDLKNIESPDTQNNSYLNEVSVLLWGVNGQFEDNVRSRDAIQQIGTLPLQSNLLYRKDFGGKGGDFFDWQTFSKEIDLGNGYDSLFFKVASNNSFGSGDFVAIDNVSLLGDSQPPTTDSSGDPSPIEEPSGSGSDGGGVSNDSGESSPPDNSGSDAPGSSETAQPVVSFSFDEGSGDRVSDESGAGSDNAGFLKNNATWIERGEGHAIALSGGRDTVTIESSPDIDKGIQDKRTISLWFQADETGTLDSGQKQVIYDEGGTGRGLNIYVDEDRLYVGGWNRPDTESGWKGTWLSTERVEAGRWQHVALVLDGTETVADDAISAYLDGQLIGSGEGSQLWAHSGKTSLGTVSDGTRFHDGTTANGLNGFAGTIDNLHIFNNALSASDIDTLSDPSTF